VSKEQRLRFGDLGLDRQAAGIPKKFDFPDPEMYERETAEEAKSLKNEAESLRNGAKSLSISEDGAYGERAKMLRASSEHDKEQALLNGTDNPSRGEVPKLQKPPSSRLHKISIGVKTAVEEVPSEVLAQAAAIVKAAPSLAASRPSRTNPLMLRPGPIVVGRPTAAASSRGGGRE